MPGLDSFFERSLTNTFTVTDAYKRILLAQDFFEQSLYGTGTATSGAALLNRYEGGADRASAEAVAAWGDDALQFLSGGDLHTKIDAIKARLASCPQLVLYVPASLSESGTASIGSWCREHVQNNLLLDVRVDRAAAGGCVFVWQNVLHDFSFPYFFKKHQDEVAALLSPHDASQPAHTE